MPSHAKTVMKEVAYTITADGQMQQKASLTQLLGALSGSAELGSGAKQDH